MSTALLELVPAVFELLAFGLGTVALTVAGAYIERFALATAQSGEAALGAWVALMGLMAFFFAYLMATDKVGPRVATLRRRLRESAE